MRNTITYTIILALAVATIYLLVERQGAGGSEHIQPDTVYVDVPYKVEVVKEKRVPYKVVVHTPPDTVYRKQRCDTTIVEKVKWRNGKLEVAKLDRDGRIFVDHYSADGLKYLMVDPYGNVETKRKSKIGLAIKKTGTHILAFGAGLVTGKIIFK